jgi:hypothetical protein
MAVLSVAARATVITAARSGTQPGVDRQPRDRHAIDVDGHEVLLDRASLPQSTLTGRFGAQSEKLEDAVRDLRRKGFLPADLEAMQQGGRATADATLTGTLSSPRLEARLTADSLTLGGVEQVRAEAQVRLEGRAVEITRMTAEASGNGRRKAATAGSGRSISPWTRDSTGQRSSLLRSRPSGGHQGRSSSRGGWTDRRPIRG